jgi:hypothetical protein
MGRLRYNRLMRWWASALALVCLAAVPSASAKELTKVVAVGANGSSVLRGLTWSALRPSQWSQHAAQPTGPFVLVYPLMERGVPAQPGRFYPGAHTVCYSWDRVTAGECFPATSTLETALSGRAAIEAPPAILTRLVVSGHPGSVQTNAGVAIELAFNRPELARRVAKRPKHCAEIGARWAGPEATRRPRLFWACAKGLWTAGKLLPAGRLLL